MINLVLSGKTILITRPESDSAEISGILAAAGFRVLSFPVIEISPVKNFSLLDEKLVLLKNYGGLIFTSSNAVRCFFDRMNFLSLTPDLPIYAVGEKTAASVKQFGYEVSYIPEDYNSEELAKMLKEKSAIGSRFLFPSGNLSMKAIVEKVSNVDEVVVYETKKPSVTGGKDETEQKLNDGEIDCVAFFSPSAITNFLEIFPEFKQNKTAIAAIGKTTKKRAEESGLRIDILAARSSATGIGEAIIKYFNAE